MASGLIAYLRSQNQIANSLADMECSRETSHHDHGGRGAAARQPPSECTCHRCFTDAGKQDPCLLLCGALEMVNGTGRIMRRKSIEAAAAQEEHRFAR